MQTQAIPATAVASQQTLESLLAINEGDTLADVRVRVEAALGLSEPIPMAALRRMLVDDEYFHHLIATRSAPRMLAHLLSAPGNRAFAQDEPDDLSGGATSGAEHTSASLLVRAATAFSGWAKGGFSRVDDDVYARRLAACLACEQLSKPPAGVLVYKVAGLFAADKRTCAACGCFVNAKARLPSENCPLTSETSPDISRWGERLSHNG